MNQYNDKYINIIYEGKPRRLYNELTTNSYTALFSETQINLINLAEKFNFKVFYFKCSSKTNYKISFEKLNYANIKDQNVQIIKKLLCDDLYYLYENCLYEVLFTIPKLNDKNNYYFDMLLVVNENFKINDVFYYNFNLINVIGINEIQKKNITYDWVESVFNSRVIFNDNLPDLENDYFIHNKIDLPYDEYVKFYKNGSDDFDFQEYMNVSSFIFYTNLNQNEYVKFRFNLLDMQIWSFDRIYVKEKNAFGFCCSYTEEYKIDSVFLTNFAELVGAVSVKKNEKDLIVFENDTCTYCSLSDNFNDQCIIDGNLNKESVKTGFANLENLEIKETWEMFV